MTRSRLIALLQKIGQSHLLAGTEELSSSQLEQFLVQLEQHAPILEEQKALLSCSKTVLAELKPCTTVEYKGNSQNRSYGEAVLKRGSAGCLILAGGQGTRLGFSGPKGTIAVTPVKEKSLFQLFAERVLAASVWAGEELPLSIMTSEENHEQTVSFFKKHHYFGLNPASVSFFTQKQLPFIDDAGLWQLKSPGRLAEGPDGNGHALHLFFSSGLWQKWKERGVEYVNVIPVDNALADPFDLDFIGYTVRAQLDAALKAVERRSPQEAMGVVVETQGKMRVIEYSELPLNPERFSLSYAGMFCLSMSFIHSLASQHFPLHLARKDVELWKPSHTYKTKMGKCEYFLFDLLPFALSSAAFVCPRELVYAPLKNAVGEHSLSAVREALQKRDQLL